MQKNEYDAAEAVEIGNAENVILGEKTPDPDLDSAGGTPPDRHYRE